MGMIRPVPCSGVDMGGRVPRNSRGPIVQLPSWKIGEYCRFGYGGNCSSKQGALIYPDP